MIVRNATPADAAAMAALRHASIQQLCSADHNDDPVLIANWIGAPDKFTQLLRQNEVSLFVAVVDGEIAGLCGFKDDLVVLNYVHPQFRLRGVSKAMMQALETRMAALGIVAGRLKSTATALRFYRSIGWIDAGIGSPSEGYPMEKRL